MILKTIIIITCLLSLLVMTINCQTEDESIESVFPDINLREVKDSSLVKFPANALAPNDFPPK